MSPKDNNASLNFDELRRRHEEYKQRQARAAAAVKKTKQTEAADMDAPAAKDDIAEPIEAQTAPFEPALVRLSAIDETEPVAGPSPEEVDDAETADEIQGYDEAEAPEEPEVYFEE